MNAADPAARAFCHHRSECQARKTGQAGTGHQRDRVGIVIHAGEAFFPELVVTPKIRHVQFVGGIGLTEEDDPCQELELTNRVDRGDPDQDWQYDLGVRLDEFPRETLILGAARR